MAMYDYHTSLLYTWGGVHRPIAKDFSDFDQLAVGRFFAF